MCLTSISTYRHVTWPSYRADSPPPWSSRPARRPFIYFPLANHFEQQYHVRHRLDRYGAGIAMDYATSTAHDIAESIAKALSSPVDYVCVESDGAARAAALIADLI